MRGVGRARYEQLVSEWFGSEMMSDIAVTDDGKLLEKGLLPVNLILCGIITTFCVFWLAFVIYGNRDRIKRQRSRDFLLTSMGLNRKFSHKDLVEGANHLFSKIDKNHSKCIMVSTALCKLEELEQDITLSDIAYILGKKPLGLTSGKFSRSASFTAPITKLIKMSSVRQRMINSDDNAEILTPDSLLTTHEWRKVIIECVMGDTHGKNGEGGLHSVARRSHVDAASEDLRESVRAMFNELMFEVRLSRGSRQLNTPRHGKGSRDSSHKNVLALPERVIEASSSQEGLMMLQHRTHSAPEVASGTIAEGFRGFGYPSDLEEEKNYTSVTSCPAGLVSELSSNAPTNDNGGSGWLNRSNTGSAIVGTSGTPPSTAAYRTSSAGPSAELGFYSQIRPNQIAYSIPSAPSAPSSSPRPAPAAIPRGPSPASLLPRMAARQRAVGNAGANPPLAN